VEGVPELFGVEKEDRPRIDASVEGLPDESPPDRPDRNVLSSLPWPRLEFMSRKSSLLPPVNREAFSLLPGEVPSRATLLGSEDVRPPPSPMERDRPDVFDCSLSILR
jgi:hypothetical protein